MKLIIFNILINVYMYRLCHILNYFLGPPLIESFGSGFVDLKLFLKWSRNQVGEVVRGKRDLKA